MSLYSHGDQSWSQLPCNKLGISEALGTHLWAWQRQRGRIGGAFRLPKCVGRGMTHGFRERSLTQSFKQDWLHGSSECTWLYLKSWNLPLNMKVQVLFCLWVIILKYFLPVLHRHFSRRNTYVKKSYYRLWVFWFTLHLSRHFWFSLHLLNLLLPWNWGYVLIMGKNKNRQTVTIYCAAIVINSRSV